MDCPVLREKMGPSLLLGSVFECLNNISPPPFDCGKRKLYSQKYGNPYFPKGPTMEPIKLHIVYQPAYKS